MRGTTLTHQERRNNAPFLLTAAALLLALNLLVWSTDGVLPLRGLLIVAFFAAYGLSSRPGVTRGRRRAFQAAAGVAAVAAMVVTIGDLMS